jgi:hypothetical protein
MMDQKNYQQANNLCSYLWVGIDRWHYDVVVDLHPISHGWRRSIPQWSHQNVLTTRNEQESEAPA